MSIYNRFCLSFLFATGLATASSNVLADEDLIDYMRGLQYFTHKTGLAIDQKNADLASFYTHEIEEILEDVEEIKSYDGHSIGTMAKKILQPAFYDLEDTIKAKQWTNTSNRFDKLINACNHCHKDTDHGYVKIVRNKNNPYMQSFKP